MSNAQTPAATKPADKNEKNYIRLALSNIRVDHDWNVRSGGWRDVVEAGPADAAKDKAGEDDEKKELTLLDLANSIALHGQDTPVVVRPNKKGGKAEYDLVAGFRRYEAHSINAKNGTLVPGWTSVKEPSILAIVKELDEEAAQALNTRENTERSNLSPADLAYRVHTICAEHKKKTGTDLSMTAVGQLIGMSHNYVGRLSQLWAGQADEINAEWRAFKKGALPANGGDPMSVNKRMGLLAHPKGSKEQIDAYKALKALRATETKGNDQNWMPNSERAAGRLGFFLGRMVREKVIVLEKPAFGKHIRDIALSSSGLLSVHNKVEANGATADQWKALAKAANAGWEEGMAPDPAKEEPTPKEPKEAKANGAKAKVEGEPKAADSKPASA